MGLSKPVISLYDAPFWDHAREGRLSLQRCSACDSYRYPPAPVCPGCLLPSAAWVSVSGRGAILSWVIFHRQYFDDYPPPYNVIAVCLDEGPILTTHLVGPTPEGNWIGHRVKLTFAERENGFTLPVAELEELVGGEAS